MKQQKRTLKELYALAKGKPASCCDTDSSSNAVKTNKASEQCCSAKKEGGCC